MRDTYRGKKLQESFPTKRFQNTEALNLICTDFMGPITLGSFNFGNKYIITFTDDATGFAWAYLMPNKTNVHSTVADDYLNR